MSYPYPIRKELGDAIRKCRKSLDCKSGILSEHAINFFLTKMKAAEHLYSIRAGIPTCTPSGVCKYCVKSPCECSKVGNNYALSPEEEAELLAAGFCQQEIDGINARAKMLISNSSQPPPPPKTKVRKQPTKSEEAAQRYRRQINEYMDDVINGKNTSEKKCDCGTTKAIKNATLEMHSDWCELRS